METLILQSTSDFNEGDHIDEYVLLECVQVGGEGALWTARHQNNHQVVIIKFVSKPDWHSLELFEIERAPIIGLDHPNIREVYHSGVVNEIPFTCMRFYPSGSVQGLIDERRLSVQEILIIAAQITSALDHIHSRRIVHRDLKPTNMLMDSKMHVYLTDFGLARQVSESTRLFHTGHGSAPYSPPEQHIREEITPQSDIYSFGIILYRLFSGELPWEGKVALAIKQLENNTPLPAEPLIGSGLPPALIDGLRILTERDPKQRPKSAIESFGLIASILDGNPPEPVSIELGQQYLEKYLAKVEPYSEPQEFEVQEALRILERSSDLWVMGNRSFDLSMTEFTYIDSVINQQFEIRQDISEEQRQMMAYGAIKYAVNHNFWWNRLESEKLKVELIDLIISHEGAKAIQRSLNLILNFDQALFSEDDIFSSLILALLDVIQKVPGEIIGTKALNVLETLAKPGSDWQNEILPDSAVEQLAEIVLAGKHYSSDAAKLIGTLRLSKSLEIIWESYVKTEDPQVLEMLILINRIAGGVPNFIPLNFRINLLGHVAVEQLIEHRNYYPRAFGLIALCVALGIGFYVFVSIRMPSIFNTARILSTLGSGLLIGPIIGAGLFATEVTVASLKIIKKIPRIILGSVIGTIFVYLGFFSYHTLFLDNPPMGWVIVFASLIVSLGVSLGAGFTQSKLVRFVIGLILSGIAIYGSGAITNGTEMTPLLYYNFNEPITTIAKIAITSIFFGLANVNYHPFKLEEDQTVKI